MEGAGRSRTGSRLQGGRAARDWSLLRVRDECGNGIKMSPRFPTWVSSLTGLSYAWGFSKVILDGVVLLD